MINRSGCWTKEIAVRDIRNHKTNYSKTKYCSGHVHSPISACCHACHRRFIIKIQTKRV